MEQSPLQVAHRFIGLKETAGSVSNALVLGMLRLDASWVQDDQTAWCSAFVNFICFVLGLPRSRSLAARSWMLVGKSIALTDALPGYDVVVLKRGKNAPGADVLAAPGHVGFYVGQDAGNVQLLGGNQGDAVSIASFPKTSILKVVRITG